MKPKMLVLGGGTRVAHIKAFSSLFTVYSTDTAATAPANQFTKKTFLLPPFVDKNFHSQIIDIIDREKIDVIVPASHHSLFYLKDRYDDIKNRTLVLCSKPSSLDVALDKYRTTKLFTELGLDTPKIYEDAPTFPVFMKPIHGSGAINNFSVSSETHLKMILAGHPNIQFLIQELVVGDEFTIDGYRDKNGIVLFTIPRKRIEVRSGEVVKSTTVQDQFLSEASAKIADALEIFGPFCVQCFKTNTGYKFIEVNPRFGGGITLSIKSGAAVPKYIYNDLKGTKSNTLRSYKILTMSRYYSEVFF